MPEIVMPTKIIGIIGSRKRDTRKDFRLVESAFIFMYSPGDIIVSGLCPTGGDRFAIMLVEKYKVDYVWFPADWNHFGQGAGKYRNTFVAYAVEHLIATPHRTTGGTDDTITKFVKRNGRANLILL